MRGYEFITAGGQIAYLKFTPSQTGKYIFESTNTSGDPYGYLYDSGKNQLAYNDDGAGSLNFQIVYDLTAGTTYYYGIKFYSSSATGTISYKLTFVGPIWLGVSSQGWGSGAPGWMKNYPGGWGTEKTGGDSDNRANANDDTLYVAQYDKNQHSLVYSKDSRNFYGIYQIDYTLSVGGKRRR